MSRTNRKIESLVARRAMRINEPSPRCTIERVPAGLRMNRDKDDAAGRLASHTSGSAPVTTSNYLRVSRENLTAAESALRDADFAAETSNLTRARILASSAASVLQLVRARR